MEVKRKAAVHYPFRSALSQGRRTGGPGSEWLRVGRQEPRGGFEKHPYPVSLLAGLVLLAALLGSDCALRRRQPVIPVEQLTAERVVDYLKNRGATLKTLEARIEIDGSGLTLLLPKLFGALRIIRLGPDLGLQVQAYLPLGAPVFELLAQGENFQLFVPGEGRCYTNSTALLFGHAPAGTVTDLFAAAGFPANLFYDQIGLIFGHLPRPGAEYHLAQEQGRLVLEESLQGASQRRIYLDPQDLSFLGLEAGGTRVDLKPRSHRRREAVAWLPRRLVFQREGLTFKLTLNQVQVNHVEQPAIHFRDPGRLSLYLVEPPASAEAPFSN
jgi:hypothetical protein